MKCPYCNDEMNQGYIQCRDGLYWTPKKLNNKKWYIWGWKYDESIGYFFVETGKWNKFKRTGANFHGT